MKFPETLFAVIRPGFSHDSINYPKEDVTVGLTREQVLYANGQPTAIAVYRLVEVRNFKKTQETITKVEEV